MTQPAGFPLEPGDSVTYIGVHGFDTGYFVRWNRSKAAVVRKPAGGHVTIDAPQLRPCNDGRMVRLRGYSIPWPSHHESPSTSIKRK